MPGVAGSIVHRLEDLDDLAEDDETPLLESSCPSKLLKRLSDRWRVVLAIDGVQTDGVEVVAEIQWKVGILFAF